MAALGHTGALENDIDYQDTDGAPDHAVCIQIVNLPCTMLRSKIMLTPCANIFKIHIITHL